MHAVYSIIMQPQYIVNSQKENLCTTNIKKWYKSACYKEVLCFVYITPHRLAKISKEF